MKREVNEKIIKLKDKKLLLRYANIRGIRIICNGDNRRCL